MKFKRRINLIIGKRQLILAGLTVLLGVAIYVNYIVAANAGDNKLIDDSDGESKTAGGNYGDVTFVDSTQSNKDSKEDTPVQVSDNSENVQADAYFAQARLDKQQSRDEALEVLQNMLYGGDSTTEEIQVVAQDAVAISNLIEVESKVENILKAQGFSDVLCYLTETSANVIVKTGGLDAAGAAKIKNALLSEITVPAENITIVEIK